MGIHSRFSSGLSTHQLIPLLSPRHAYIPRGICAWERERDGKKKHSISHWLWRLTAVRRGSTTLVRNNCRNWREKQRIRTPFSLRENLINSKDCNFVRFQICIARKESGFLGTFASMRGRFDGIIVEEKKRTTLRRYVNIHVVTKTASAATLGGILAPRFLDETFEIRWTSSRDFNLFYIKNLPIPLENIFNLINFAPSHSNTRPIILGR